MKIFWEDALGNSCPNDATFGIMKFGSKKLTSFSKWERISKLPAFEGKIPVSSIQYDPPLNTWKKNVETALKNIQEKKLEKVVLARSCTITLPKKIDPLQILSKLKILNQNGQLFGLIGKKFAFIGCTPELLFSRNDSEIVSQALAGTVPRGMDETEDACLAKILTENPKLRAEIELVKNYLLDQLKNTSSRILLSPLTVSKTPFVQHLSYLIHAKLKKNIRDHNLLKSLHPTPALCGLPQKMAEDFIKCHEPFPRDLYAAAIGWYNKNASDWKVAIRCCLVKNDKVTFYTGAGIVEGSDPDLEWQELNDKMRLYKEIFEIP